VEPVYRRTIEAIERHFAAIRDLRVVPDVGPEQIRSHLEQRYGAFEAPQPLEALVDDVQQMFERWNIQIAHPRYFGLYNPSVLPAGVAADALVAAFNPQLATWSHAQGSNEIERFTLDHLLRVIGFDPAASAAHFTSGGAEANLTGVLTAIARAAPAHGEVGVEALPPRSFIYLSEESHHSFEKVARMVGLGRRALRLVPVDGRLRLDPEALRAMIGADRAAGHHPLLIVGTAGTTSAGAIDPLPELARIAAAERVWLHVDAAWGGGALMSPALRGHLAGIEQADSVTWDAHKWLSVPMGAGMYFCRHRDVVLEAFSLQTGYMPAATAERPDPYRSSVQWSRRSIGLKVFMTLAALGMDGYAQLIEHQTDMGNQLRKRLQDAGWRIVNDTPLPVVCFTHDRLEHGELSPPDLLGRIYELGDVWISAVRLPRAHALRACITSFRTEPADLDRLMQTLASALARV
jgi:aromatic-L-amino-acid/L-tryptophan decarboxylase